MTLAQILVLAVVLVGLVVYPVIFLRRYRDQVARIDEDETLSPDVAQQNRAQAKRTATINLVGGVVVVIVVGVVFFVWGESFAASDPDPYRYP